MTRYLAVACTFAMLLVAASAAAQQKATISGIPDIPFTTVPNFLKLPAGEYLGESVAVATDSKGNIYVYHRRDTTRLFQFDRSGNFVKEIGKGYYGFEFAHSVRVDKDDNIWTVDEGTNLVTKFSPDGKVLMVLGHRPSAVDGPVVFPAGPNQPSQKYIFCRPTDVGWDPQGIFVSDGYCNNRVVKYDERPVRGAGGQRESGEGAWRVQPAARPASGRARQCVGRRPHQQPLPGARQQPEADQGNHESRRRLDAVHLARAASVRIPLELEPERQCTGHVGDHRRDL
jgi:hypothetical protein